MHSAPIVKLLKVPLVLTLSTYTINNSVVQTGVSDNSRTFRETGGMTRYLANIFNVLDFIIISSSSGSISIVWQCKWRG